MSYVRMYPCNHGGISNIHEHVSPCIVSSIRGWGCLRTRALKQSAASLPTARPCASPKWNERGIDALCSAQRAPRRQACHVAPPYQTDPRAHQSVYWFSLNLPPEP
jgi:hypothetical protein